MSFLGGEGAAETGRGGGVGNAAPFEAVSGRGGGGTLGGFDVDGGGSGGGATLGARGECPPGNGGAFEGGAGAREGTRTVEDGGAALGGARLGGDVLDVVVLAGASFDAGGRVAGEGGRLTLGRGGFGASAMGGASVSKIVERNSSGPASSFEMPTRDFDAPVSFHSESAFYCSAGRDDSK